MITGGDGQRADVSVAGAVAAGCQESLMLRVCGGGVSELDCTLACTIT